MATLVLGAVGMAVGGPAGGFAGGLVGGLIDNFLLFPWAFPTEPLQGPRLTDLSIQQASDGSPMKWAIGPRTRFAGTIMWTPRRADGSVEFIEVQDEIKVSKNQKAIVNSYFLHIAIHIADTSDTPGRRVRRMWAGTTLIYDLEGTTGKYDSVTFYDGTQTSPDPLMAAVDGADETPDHRGSFFVVFERLALESNAIPSITFEYEQNPDTSLGQAISYALDRVMDTSEYDVSQLPFCFKGLFTSGYQTTADILAPMLMTYAVNVQEGDGKLVFSPRSSDVVVDIDPDDLAASGGDGDTSNHPIRYNDTNDYDMPDVVVVRYVNANDNLQQGSVTVKRRVSTARNGMVVDVPLTLTPIEAKALAYEILWTVWAERQTVELSLPPKYIDIREGDVIRVRGERLLVREYAEGANYEVRISGSRFQPHIYRNLSDTLIDDSGSSAYRPPATVGDVWDGPALAEDHTGKIGIYAAMCAEDADALWKGGQVWSGTTTLSSIGTTPQEAYFGFTTGGLDVGPTEFPDTRNQLDFKLTNGSVSACTEDEFIAGLNVLAVKTSTGEYEYIGFKNVELLGDNEYRVSRLIRGMRGTEHLVGKHLPAGAEVIVLSAGTSKLVFIEQGSAVLGVTTDYKLVAVEGLVGDYDAITRTTNGLTMRPFSPTNLQGYWDPDSSPAYDFVLSWDRRGKKFASPFGPAGGALSPDESPETYVVEFRFGGALSPVLRTKTVTGTRTVTYTYDEQVEDGLSPGATGVGTGVRCDVYMVSQVVGLSPPGSGAFVP